MEQFSDYVGIRNVLSVTERDFILNIFGGHDKYREYMVDRVKQATREHLQIEIRDVIIEVQLR
jgi:hypothetical protein